MEAPLWIQPCKQGNTVHGVLQMLKLLRQQGAGARWGTIASEVLHHHGFQAGGSVIKRSSCDCL